MAYQITKTAPIVYLDTSGSAVNGFRVTVFLEGVEETHFVNVPSLDPVAVNKAIQKLEGQRQALNDLGKE